MSAIAQTPFVSVIIPAYNGDRFIAETIETVLRQTYPHFEIIVIDDGSIDRTRAVLEPYGDRIRYVYQDNQGVAAARNRGLELTEGEFVVFLDQDDICHPDKLALQISCFQEHPEAGMVHSGWQRVDADGKPLADVEMWHQVPVLDAAGWLQWMPILFSAMMFRREWLERVGPLDSGFKQACDVDLVQRLVLLGCQTAWVRQITVGYRQHDRNDSLNTLVQAEESWAVRRKFFDRPDLPDPIRRLENSACYSTLVWIAWRLCYTGYTSEMVRYLEKSLQYTPVSFSRTLSAWVTAFTGYAEEYRYKLDFYTLSNSTSWRNLISTMFI
ncbi:MAG TPA: glycosyltransferase [Oscillatoriales cyanobacterium M59_W2019_021]|nr:glycosyltransferase [Oscillatoriales cyanobacterium M59_W2019_021]